MLTTCVHFQLGQHSAPQRPFRHHALNGFLDGALWGFFYQDLEADSFNAADVSGVVIIDLVARLFPGPRSFLAINHPAVITGVHLRSVPSLALPAQPAAHPAGHTPQRST